MEWRPHGVVGAKVPVLDEIYPLMLSLHHPYLLCEFNV